MKVSLCFVENLLKPEADRQISEILLKSSINKENEIDCLQYSLDENEIAKEVLIDFKTETNLDIFLQIIEDEYFEKLFMNPCMNNNLSASIESDISIIQVDNVEKNDKESTLSNSSENLKNTLVSEEQVDESIKYESKEIKENLSSSHLVVNSDQEISNKTDYLDALERSIGNDEKNMVEICFKKPLAENEKDAIMMFLENAKASGGGDIFYNDLDSKKMCLSVNYTEPLHKKRVLEKKSFKFLNYEFIAVEPLNKNKFQEDKTLLILKDFSHKEPILHVQMFSENLVGEDNDVEWIVPSKFFSTTYFVGFKQPLEFKNVKNRLKRRPLLHGYEINILPAFDTCLCILLTGNTEEKISREVIELHFENKKRCGAPGFVQIYEHDSYMVLRFDTKENAVKVASFKHKISDQELVVEYLYNFDMLDKKMVPMKPFVKKPAQIKEKAVQVQSKEKIVTQEKKIENATNTEQPRPVYKIDLAEERFKILKIDSIFGEFTKELFKYNSLVCKPENGIISIQYVLFQKSNELNDKALENWKKMLNTFFGRYLKQFKSKTIKSTKDSIQAIKFDKAKMNIEPINNEDFDLYGYNESVDEFISLLEKNEKKRGSIEIKNLKLHECRILLANKYVKKMLERFPDLNANIKSKLGYLMLEGATNEIAIAHREARDLISSLKSETLNLNEIQARFFNEKERSICAWLNEKNIECVLDVNKNEKNLIVYATTVDIIENFKANMIKEFKLLEFDLNIIDDKVEFKNTCTNMKNELGLVYIIQNDYLLNLYGFTDSVMKYYEELQTL